jgi:hypothetical protein
MTQFLKFSEKTRFGSSFGTKQNRRDDDDDDDDYHGITTTRLASQVAEI